MWQKHLQTAGVAVAVAWVVLWYPGVAAGQVDINIQVGRPAPAPYTVLTRGPVHEAFAEPVTYDASAGVVVGQQPPAPIAETPPSQMPAGQNVVWIPGYWAWDDDSTNFIWVSGFWREPPPGYDWVPGYWGQVTNGWRWVAGFWQPENQQETEYLPPPPATPENPAPQGYVNNGQIWIPGNWVWSDGRYLWRRGYYTPAQADWVWVPAHYIWSPRGYIFVAGHWDYPPERRGTLFAPVAFAQGVYAQPGFTYEPSYVIGVGALLQFAFCRPDYHHYYFGDYYDNRYAERGIYPAYDFDRRHGWYDPMYVHREWSEGRDDPRAWDARQRTNYEHYRNDAGARPARTLAAQDRQVAALPAAQRNQAMVATPLTQVVENKTNNVKYTTINNTTRQKFVQQQTEMRDFTQQRAKLEAGKAVSKTPVQEPVKSPTETPAATPPARPVAPAPTPAPPDAKPPVTTPPEAKPPVTAPPVRPPEATPPARPTPAAPEAKPPAKPDARPTPPEAKPPAPVAPPPEARPAPAPAPPGSAERVTAPKPPKISKPPGEKAPPARPEEPKPEPPPPTSKPAK